LPHSEDEALHPPKTKCDVSTTKGRSAKGLHSKRKDYLLSLLNPKKPALAEDFDLLWNEGSSYGCPSSNQTHEFGEPSENSGNRSIPAQIEYFGADDTQAAGFIEFNPPPNAQSYDAEHSANENTGFSFCHKLSFEDNKTMDREVTRTLKSVDESLTSSRSCVSCCLP
jgi:hypothetical protein